jgi:hypothetical protein
MIPSNARQGGPAPAAPGQGGRGKPSLAAGGRKPLRRLPLSRRAVDIRVLREHREFIKTTAFLLPHKAKVRVLETMERLRWERMDPRLRPPAGEPPSLPEMTGGEMVREINWRVETLPPGDAEAVARLIRHATRWQAERRTKAARAWRRAAEGPPPPPPR